MIFRLSRPDPCKNQENGAGKQGSLHAPLNSKAKGFNPTEANAFFFVRFLLPQVVSYNSLSGSLWILSPCVHHACVSCKPSKVMSQGLGVRPRPVCTLQADDFFVCFLLLFSDPPRSSPSILATVGELHSAGEENNSYVVLAGSSVELTCDGTGQESRLQYAWYRLFPERQYVTNDTVLTLHDVTGDQDNTYVCQVTDPQITTSGRSSESAIVLMVNVLGKPLFFQWNWSY